MPEACPDDFSVCPENVQICPGKAATFGAVASRNDGSLSWRVHGQRGIAHTDLRVSSGTENGQHHSILTVPYVQERNNSEIQVAANYPDRTFTFSPRARLKYLPENPIYLAGVTVHQNDENIQVSWTPPEPPFKNLYQLRVWDIARRWRTLVNQEVAADSYRFPVYAGDNGRSLEYEVSFLLCNDTDINLPTGVSRDRTTHLFIQGVEDSRFQQMPQSTSVCPGENARFQAEPGRNASIVWRIATSAGNHQPIPEESSVSGLTINPDFPDRAGARIQAELTYPDGSASVTSPTALLTHRALTARYSTDISTELCDQGLCIQWPAPEASDGERVYDQRYTLVIARQNQDGVFTTEQQLEGHSNSTSYTPAGAACLKFAVRSEYCSQSEAIIHVADREQPVYFSYHHIEPAPVTEVSAHPECDQVFVNWPPETTPEGEMPDPPVQYRINVQQEVMGNWTLIDCPGCVDHFGTNFTFIPPVEATEQQRFRFIVTPGRCDQYINQATISETVIIPPCPVATSQVTTTGEGL